MRRALLLRCAALASGAPRRVVTVALLLAVVAIVAAATRLRMNANTDDLIAPDRPFMRDYRAFLDEFGDLEFLHVVVATGDDEERARRCVDAIEERLRAIPELPGVFAKITAEEQLAIATRAMPDDELRDLAEASEGLAALATGGGPGHLLNESTQRLRRLLGVGALMSDPKQRALGAAAVLPLRVIAAAAPGSASAKELESLDLLADEYLTSGNGRFHFVQIMPAKDYGTLAVIEQPLARIRAALDEVRDAFPGMEMGLTGKPVLQADEMATTDRDMTFASILAILLVAVLFMVAMRRVKTPALAVAALLIGIAWTFGLATVLVGQLNLLSVVFTLILVGIGIDFGVHIIARYDEERTEHGCDTSVERALLTAGRGNFTGAITSSLAFLMAMFTDFQGLRELGIIAGTGLVACLVSMTVVLPALLVLFDRGARKAMRPGLPLNAAGAFDVALRRPRTTLALGLAFSAAMGFSATRTGFEENVIELQARGLESVEWERRIIDETDDSTWFGALIVDDLAQASDVAARCRALPSVGEVHSVHDVVQPMTPARDADRERIRSAAVTPVDSDVAWTRDDVRTAAETLRTLARRARGQEPEEAKALHALAVELANLANALDEDETLRGAIEQRVARAETAARVMREGDALPLRDALPAALRHRFVSPAGRYAVMAHPHENVWDTEALRTFVDELETLSVRPTGVPITHLESIVDMREGFRLAALLALGAVLLLALADFRRPLDVALAAVPLVFGTLWTVGLMGAFGLSFNLANFFAIPIIIGLGVDDGVHILHRYREGGPRRLDLGSTRRGVVLTSLTTMIGFGCLSTATHLGLRSLGMVMAIGSFCCLATSLFVLPPLLRVLERDDGRVSDSA